MAIVKKFSLNKLNGIFIFKPQVPRNKDGLKLIKTHLDYAKKQKQKKPKKNNKETDSLLFLVS